MEYYLTIKKKLTITTCNNWMDFNSISLSEKISLQRLLHDSIYTTP